MARAITTDQQKREKEKKNDVKEREKVSSPKYPFTPKVKKKDKKQTLNGGCARFTFPHGQGDIFFANFVNMPIVFGPGGGGGGVNCTDFYIFTIFFFLTIYSFFYITLKIGLQ